MNTVEEIKSRLDITDVVGQYIQMKKAGRNFKALCPFHHEKTPSFIISPEKQIAYCFGCHHGGDIFKFVMEIENIDFPEALKMLADKAGVTLTEYKSEFGKEEKEYLKEMHACATDFYEKQLASTDGKAARDYLMNRGITKGTILTFHLGFAPDSWDSLIQHLLKKKYSINDMVKAGLVVSKSSEKHYDKFRNRIMFPLYNNQGTVVGFTGRALSPDDDPKYLNTPDTPIFNKSQVLFGYNLSKEKIRTDKRVYLMEGQFDVITSYQEGLENVVAASGTAYTTHHIKILARMVDDFMLVFDSDQAGEKAALRTLERILPAEKNVKIAVLPSGEDPDSLLRKDKKEFIEYLSNSKTVIDYIAEVLCEDKLSSLKEKKQFIQYLKQIMKYVRSPITREVLIKQAAKKVDISEKAVNEELSKVLSEIKTEEVVQPQWMREDYLVGLLLNFPQYANHVIEHVPEILRQDFKYFFIYRQLLSYYNDAGQKYTINEFLSTFSDHILQNDLSIIALLVSEKYNHFDERIIEDEIDKLLLHITKDYAKLKLAVIKEDLQRAEVNSNSFRRNELLTLQKDYITLLPN